jgi:hypothetical protein
VPESQPVADTGDLRVGDPVTLTVVRDGEITIVTDTHYEVTCGEGIDMLFETHAHGAPGVTVTRREPDLPDGFGALVEADVPHPHREGGPYVRRHLIRTAGGEWRTSDGWRFSDAYLRSARVHHAGAPIQP